MKKLIMKMSKRLLMGLIVGLVVIGSGKVFGQTTAPSGIRDLATSTYSSSDYVLANGKNYEVYYGFHTADLTKLSKKTYGSTSTESAGATSWVKWGTSVGNSSASSTVHTNGEFTLTSSTRYYRVRASNQSEYQLVMVIKGYSGMAALFKSSGMLLKIEKWNGSTYVADSPTQTTGSTVSGHYRQSVVLNSVDQYKITAYGPGTGSTNYDMTAFSLEIPSCTSPTFSFQPTDNQSQCIGGTTTLGTVVADQSATYQWYSNTIKSNTGGTTVGSGNGGSTATYTPPSTTVGTYYYYCVATNGACTTASNAVQITVNETTSAPVITSEINTESTSITGTSVANASVQVYDNGSELGSPVTANGSGDWTLTGVSGLTSGHIITAKATASPQCQSNASEGVTVTVAGATPPTLTAATESTVDDVFDVTFSDDETWRAAITGITVGGTPLTEGFAISAGKITFTPSASVPAGLLQASGTKSIVVMATGYNNASVSQVIGVGAPNKLVINTQPTAPASNGGNLAQQPVVAIQDQYGNTTSGTATVSITINGTNAINVGTTSQAAVSGIVTFSGVKAGTSDGSTISSTLSFSSDGLSGATSNSFTIPTYSSGTTDYFRSKATGNWADASTWESSTNNVSWFSATTSPTSAATDVLIRSGNNVTVGANLSIGNANIESDAELIVSSGVTLTIAASKTLTVSGILRNNAGTVTPTGSLSVANGAMYEDVTTTATIPNMTFASGSWLKISGTYSGSISNINTNNSYQNIWFAGNLSSGNYFRMINTTNFTVAGQLRITSTGSGVFLPSSLTAAPGMTIASLDIQGGTLTINNNAGSNAIRYLTVTGDVQISAGTLDLKNGSNSGSGQLIVGGNFNNSGGALNMSGTGSSTGLVIFNGTSDKTFTNNGTSTGLISYTVNTTNGAKVSLGSDVTIPGTLTLTSGSIANGSNNLTLSGAISGTGTINTSGGTLTFAGTSEQTLAAVNIASGVVHNLVVNAGSKLTTSGAISATNLTIKSDVNGTGTINGSLTTENAKVQQYLTTKTINANPEITNTDHWWYISSPVTGATSASILVEGSNNKFGYHNEPNATYPQITVGNEVLTAGKGYVAQINTTGTYEFSGSLNNGNVGPLTLTRTPAAGGYRGFNLMGNPYPSYIDWNAISGFGTSPRTDIRPTVWIRTRTASGAMDFDTWDGEDGVTKSVRGTVSRYIAPMQAFWVKVHEDNTTPTITFTNNMRSHQDQSANNNKLRVPANSQRQLLRLRLENDVNFDETVISTNALSADQYDFYDSDKMSANNPTIPELYSLVDNRELVINKMLSLEAGKSVILGIRPGRTGEFSITANEMMNLEQVDVVLKDRIAQTETRLTEGETYTFTADGTASNDRFVVVFRAKDATTANDEMLTGSLHAYVNTSGHIVVLAPGHENSRKVYVRSLTGQTVAVMELHNQRAEYQKQLSPGIYLINIMDGRELQTTRVIVK